MKTLVASILTLTVGLSVAQGSVFDDAAFWYHASSPNAGGAFQTGDLTDNRYVADADHLLNQSYAEGHVADVIVREEQVVHPYAIETNVERVVYLKKEVSTGNVRTGNLHLPDLFNFTNAGPFTVVMRFRWDGIHPDIASWVTRVDVLTLGFDSGSSNTSG